MFFSQQPAVSENKQQLSDSQSVQPVTTPPAAATAVQPERRTVSVTSGGGRSISISIPGLNKPTVQHSTEATTSGDLLSENRYESYTPEAFEMAWKSFAERIPEIVSAANYIRSTLPVHLEGTSYELQFSNIMQENEFKKLTTSLSTYMRQQLHNAGISFRTKVLESAELPRSSNPEDILKKMTEENPALELLKNNLKLEID